MQQSYNTSSFMKVDSTQIILKNVVCGARQLLLCFYLIYIRGKN